MIALQSDCLLFQLASGESVPCSAEMINFEITGNSGGLLEPEMLRHAAASVFHYFKKELRRETVTVGEFAVALEKVLRKLGFIIRAGGIESRPPEADATDLGRIARESSAIAQRTPHSTPAIAARRALSRIARLRETACRRAPLEQPVRKIAGPDRRVFARLPDRRAGTKRVRAGGGIDSDTNFTN